MLREKTIRVSFVSEVVPAHLQTFRVVVDDFGEEVEEALGPPTPLYGGISSFIMTFICHVLQIS